MRLHILGIGGTFMAGVAALARELGHGVTGTDAGVYPPMSAQLRSLGIVYHEGYDPAAIEPATDLVVVGNALSRGNPVVEAVLDAGLPYTSGPQWIAEHVLAGRRVFAVAGTHGKTTTSALLAWILEYAGQRPGFLVGGVPANFGVSARLGAGGPFVIEADEYDTAFFDKRAKFLHYHPHTAILNNLEYDHADIFPDLEAIELQFHYLVRTVPCRGLLVVNAQDQALARVLERGCWTPVERFAEGLGDGWSAQPLNAEASRFRVFYGTAPQGEVDWPLIGRHNMLNALAAIAAARGAGVPVATAAEACAGFRSIERRLQVRGVERGVTVYDDFAHHPTAIAATLEALRARVGDERIVAVLELRSNTMRMGVHRDTLGAALGIADRVMLLRPQDLNWNLDRVTSVLADRGRIYPTVAAILEALATELRPRDHVLIMSNGGFEDIHARLLKQLQGSRA